MAFAAGSIFHVWSTGATTNGGGFNPTNASFATDLTTDANTANTSAPIVSSATYNFAATDVGHWLFVQGGTNWTPGWYLIASVSANKATLTGTIGTAVLYGTVITEANYHRPNGLNTLAGCATTGTPTGGVWGIDYSQNTAGPYAYTDMVISLADATQFTSVAHPIGPNLVGNTINVTSGTGFTVQRVQVTTFTNLGLLATCDKSLGTLGSTGGNGSLGGAISTIAIALGSTAAILGLVAGNKVYVKATASYSQNPTVTVTASFKGNITSGRISVEGYTTYPGQRDGRPVITSATDSVHLITCNDNDFWEWIHLKFTHTAATRGNGFAATTSNSSPVWWTDCIFDGCLEATANGNAAFSLMYLTGCEVMNCTSSSGAVASSGVQVLYIYGCDIHDNVGPGVIYNQSGGTILNFQNCIFDTNSIGIDIAATAVGNTITLHNCTFVDNIGDGLKLASNSATNTLELENNIFYGNGGYGIDNLDAQIETEASLRINRNNAYGSNSSGPMTGLSAGRGDITLTADPFTSRAGRDFSLNSTAGGGAALKAVAFPGAFPAGTTTSYQDVGAAQHADPASGGVVVGTPVLGAEGMEVI